jgi:hypothetical protein
MESCVRERAPAPSAFSGRVRTRPGPSKTAPRRRIIVFRCVAGDWYRQSIRHRSRLTGVVRRDRGWTAGSSDPHSRRARPLRSCPRPDGAAYKSRNRAFGPGVVWAAGADLPRRSRESVSGHPRRAQQGRVTPGTGHLRPFRPRSGALPVAGAFLPPQAAERTEKREEESEEPDAAFVIARSARVRPHRHGRDHRLWWRLRPVPTSLILSRTRSNHAPHPRSHPTHSPRQP